MAKTILLADDSLTIQKVVELTFMDQDYQVTAVGDGLTALSRWNDSRPDLVIADVHMPGADGYEVCRQVKRSRPGTPVLLLVGTFEIFDEAQAQSCGADGHLKKPFDSQELFRLVERLIAENAARQAPPAPAYEAPAPADPFAAPPAFPSSPFPAAPFPAAPAYDAPAPASFAAAPSYNPPAYSPAPAAPSFAPAPAFAPAPVFDQAPAAPAFSPAAPDFGFGAPAAPSEPAYSAAPAPEPSFAPAPAYAPAPEPVAAVPVPVTAAPAAPRAAAETSLSDADIDRIARRVVELIGDRAVKEIAWEVVPDLAEVVIRERIRELESQVQ